MVLKLPGGWVISKPGSTPVGTELVPGETDTADVIQAVIVDEPEVANATLAQARKRTKKEKPPKRPLLLRLFGVSIWGGLKLIVLCVIIGGAIMVWQEAERAAQENAAAVAGQAAQQVWAGAVWTAQNFWQPALYGAGFVAPVWVLWRVITLPFRR
ncbi:MAG: hypothetical protein AAF829_03395 [Pseudomonadota bacterium]